jgi:hypothetical protein
MLKIFKSRIRSFLEYGDIQGFLLFNKPSFEDRGTSASGCSRIHWKGVLDSFS